MAEIPKTFDPLSIEDTAKLLAFHHPGGLNNEMLQKDKPFGLLMISQAAEHVRFMETVRKAVDEMQIDSTEDLLEEWERSVGIPNECFLKSIDKPTRRKQIQSVYSKFGGAQTEDDFIRIADFFNIEIRFVDNGLPPGKERAHTWSIEVLSSTVGTQFPYTFPIVFSLGATGFLQCIFNKLAPANINVVITQP